MSMGLYIPDLRLPADGDFELWIAVRKDGSFTYNVRGGWQDGKQKAVHVPPHGDLIDRDEQIELYADTDDLQLANMKVPIAVIRQNIMDMPTIIPAEEGET
jgi:hypothetical protein